MIMLPFPSCSLHTRLNTFSFVFNTWGKKISFLLLFTYSLFLLCVCVSHDTCSGTQAEIMGQDPGTNSGHHACVI